VANSQEIVNWSLLHQRQLSLKVEYYTGLQTYFPELYDIGIFIEINGDKNWGRGTDSDEKVAYCKALSEAVERSCLKIFDIKNSNGLAVHPDRYEACRIAKSEVLERDAFMCGFLLGNTFKQAEVPSQWKNIVSSFRLIGIEIKIFEMCSYENGSGYLALAEGYKSKKPFGYIMGSSFAESSEVSKNKALIEVLRNLDHVVRVGDVDSISIEDFNLKNSFNFHDHGLLAKNLDYAFSIRNIFDSSKCQVITPPAVDDDFKYQSFDPSRFPVPELPLYMVQCSNSNLQNLYDGPTTEDKVNLLRLSSVAGSTLSFSSLNLIPHPFD